MSKLKSWHGPNSNGVIYITSSPDCYKEKQFSSVQLLSGVRLFVTPWIAAHQASLFIPEFTQTHIHWVSDTIQPSHPLSSPSPPAPSPSQHQSLFQWVNSSHEVAKVLEFQFQHHSLQRNPRADLLQNGLVGSLCSPRDSQESSPTPQFKGINSSALSLLHSPTLASIHDHRKNHSLWLDKEIQTSIKNIIWYFGRCVRGNHLVQTPTIWFF